MTSRRIQYGRCSFVPPEGFTVEEKASSPGATSSGCSRCGEAAKEPVSITLTKPLYTPGRRIILKILKT